MHPLKKRDLTIALAFLVALVALPLALGSSRYLLSVLMNCAGLSLIAFGVWLTFTIGRINICQAGFALVGRCRAMACPTGSRCRCRPGWPAPSVRLSAASSSSCAASISRC